MTANYVEREVSMKKKICKINTALRYHNLREYSCVQYKLWHMCTKKKLGRMTQKSFCRYGKIVHFRIDGPMITRSFNTKKISDKNIVKLSYLHHNLICRQQKKLCTSVSVHVYNRNCGIHVYKKKKNLQTCIHNYQNMYT